MDETFKSSIGQINSLSGYPKIPSSEELMRAINQRQTYFDERTMQTRRVTAGNATTQSVDPLVHDASRLRMIGLRMRWPEAAPVPFDFLQTHLAGDKVIVFVVVGGKPVTLEDEAGLFPSDTLITQLRLIQK